MASLLTIFDVRTQDQVLTGMYTLGATLGVDVVGVQAERLFRTLFEIEARAKAREDELRLQVAQAGFLGTVKLAGSEWVDLIAEGWFSLRRSPATYTYGTALLTCGPIAVGGTVGARRFRCQSASGVNFVNAEAFTVVPNTVVPVTLVATEPGTTGNVPVNTITKINTTIANTTIANPGTNGSWITSVAVDAESDDSLLARCLARWSATSYGGAASAYRDWITNAFAAAGIASPLTRIGVDDTNPNGPGSTDLYLASSSGPAVVTDVAIVDTFLQPRRSLGTGPLRTFAAPELIVPIAATIYGNANGVALGTAALQTLQSTIPLGGKVYFSTLNALLRGLPNVYDVAFTSPAPGVNVSLSGFQVAIFNPTLAAFA